MISDKLKRVSDLDRTSMVVEIIEYTDLYTIEELNLYSESDIKKHTTFCFLLWKWTEKKE